MAVYRDIDSDVRIGGSLTLPTGSLTIGGVNIISALNQKANASHTHSIANITGLQSALDGKANTSHTHTFASLTGKPTTLSGYGITDAAKSDHLHDDRYLKLSGGTMNGDIVFNNVKSNASNKITWTGLTNNHSIYTEETEGDESVRLVIHSEDNGDKDYVLFRNRNGSTTKDVMEIRHSKVVVKSNLDATEGLDVTGNITVTGTVDGVDIAALKSSFDSHHHDAKYLGKTEKAADSDKLDGLESSQFLRSDASDTTTGNLTIERNNPVFHLKGGVNYNSDIYMTEESEQHGIRMRYAGADKNEFQLIGRQNNIEVIGLTMDRVVSSNGLKYKGNTIWHAGNFNPSQYLKSGGDNISFGNNFTVAGKLSVGNVNNISGDILVYNSTGGAAIHLDGDSSGMESTSATKVYIAGNGNARFTGTLHANTITTDNKNLVTNLNAEYLNGKKDIYYAKNESIRDVTGYGVVRGMNAIAYGGELHIEPGVAFTASGMRIEVRARTKVPMTPPSSSGNRNDIVYIAGPSMGTDEGKVLYYEGPIGGSAPLTDPFLSDAVIIATVFRAVNQASIVASDINNDVRNQGNVIGTKPFYVEEDTQNVKARYEVHAKKYKENGKYLDQIYARLSGGNTFNNSQIFNGDIQLNDRRIRVKGPMNSSSVFPGIELYEENSSGTKYGFSLEYLSENNVLSLKAFNYETNNHGERFNIERDSGRATFYGHMILKKNAQTVTIKAGQRQATWTHNFGNTNYAVNLTPNSFERHVRWTNKTENSIVVEIDDPSTKDILVDCILIGY